MLQERQEVKTIASDDIKFEAIFEIRKYWKTLGSNLTVILQANK